jgi:hypothetical protein
MAEVERNAATLKALVTGAYKMAHSSDTTHHESTAVIPLLEKALGAWTQLQVADALLEYAKQES